MKLEKQALSDWASLQEAPEGDACLGGNHVRIHGLGCHLLESSQVGELPWADSHAWLYGVCPLLFS